MRVYQSVIPFLFIFLFSFSCLNGQNWERYERKLNDHRHNNWPPEGSYSRVSLGYALQDVFKKHTDFCGFKISDGRRDYVPSDISRFLGRRDLRTKVETANIRGGGLLYYIFSREEVDMPFDNIPYVPSRVFRTGYDSEEFIVNPDENFDSFILTKNCGGYLKAALDAGIEPPYAAFKTALNTDDRRESTVVALSGSFLSPLKVILDANDWRTTEAMMNLWKFYKDNPEYINRAYYLREFQGVLIKHVSQAEENFKLEAGIGVNINAPLGARLKAGLNRSHSGNVAFSGTDWQTIVFADFGGPYTKYQIFSPLPSPRDISAYFQARQINFQQAKDYPLMTEGAEHKHHILVEGIPEEMTYHFWELEAVSPGVYENNPVLVAEPFHGEGGSFGCRFTVKGRPSHNHFQGPLTMRPAKVKVAYRIRSRYPIGGEYIRFNINEELQTSAHPIASISGGEFDLTKREDRRFAFQWKFIINIEDGANPVDFNINPYLSNLTATRSDKKVDVVLGEVRPDPAHRRYFVTIESLDTYPLEKIDDQNMVNYNLSIDMHLQSARSTIRAVRPIKGILSFPSIKPDPEPVVAAPEPLPAVPLQPEVSPVVLPKDDLGKGNQK